MPHLNWIVQSMIDVQRKDEEKVKLINFWNTFYSHLTNIQKEDNPHKTKSYQYKEEVFDILLKGKQNLSLGEDELHKIQLSIEDLTLKFDEESLFRSVPNIIKILIKNDEECAKDILRKRLKNQKDIELISEFGQYTIEALIVHVLSMLFNSVDPETSMIRVSTLIERLDNSVRTQALLLINRRCQKTFTMSTETTDNENGKKRSKLEKMYPIGSGLVEFMDERGLITLMNDTSGNVRVMKNKGAYFIPSHLYAVCNFDISLLPIKLNLPMVCKPLDWRSACPEGEEPRTLSDLSGGYLSGPTGEIYDRYRLLSTGSLNHYFIDIGRGKGDYLKLCDIMNKLQNQAFQINSDWLQYIINNEQSLVEYGYLKPRFLVSLNLKKASDLLREFHMMDKVINKLCSFSELLQTLNKNIQCSRYEDLILKLARAYDGYHFYLPAFLDFRGRIYRSGILHFHERDLARSLILFAAGTKCEASQSNIDNIIEATAFHYKKFTTVNDAKYWFVNNISQITENSIYFAREAKHPFQFLAKTLGLINNKTEVLMNTPITQDASASAYQIMSYFLMDEILAKRTNLIPSEDDQIQDLYSFLLEELIEFMKAELDNKSLSNTVCHILNRNIVKNIFMPIIYGKTIMSTTTDLKEHLSHYITYKDCSVVAKACFKFWNQRCPGMNCLIRLIRHIGWIASAGDRPVFYKVPFFTTVQDYMKMESTKIWVYDRLHKKKRGVTLRIATSKRNRMKTVTSTFVNFIHQRDAYIAMNVVEEMLLSQFPIYTVHDNFICTVYNSNLIPIIYSNVFRKMGPPHKIINDFIYMNVMKHIHNRESNVHPFMDKRYNSSVIIPKEELEYFLRKNIPSNISKKMLESWEENISGILTCYETYTRQVCGNSLTELDKRWTKFMLKLRSEQGKLNYCVHY